MRALVAASALRGVGASIARTFLPVYAVLVGMGVPEVGVATTIALAVAVTLTPLIGVATDFIGRRVVMMASTGLIALALLLPMALGGALGVILAYVLLYASLFSWVSSRGAFVVETVDAKVMGSSFALLSLSFQLTGMVTPYVAGALIARLGYAPTFTAGSAVTALALLAVALGVEEDRPARRASLRDFLDGLKPRRGEGLLHLALSVDRASWSLWFPILNSYLKADLGLSEELIGLLGTCTGVATALGLPLAGRLVDRLGWRTALAASEGLGALASLLIAVSTGLAQLAVATSLIGLSIALWIPGYNVAIPSIVGDKEGLGRAYSRADFYRSLSSVPAPWLGGSLYTLCAQLPMLVNTGLLLFNTWLITRLRPHAARG